MASGCKGACIHLQVTADRLNGVRALHAAPALRALELKGQFLRLQGNPLGPGPAQLSRFSLSLTEPIREVTTDAPSHSCYLLHGIHQDRAGD